MNPKAILLIEDNPSDIDLTKRALEKGGVAHTLIVAEDGQEALDLLLGAGPDGSRDTCDLPTLALLDLKLPRVPGLEVLRRVRADTRTRRLPVVVLTTSREEGDISLAYELGANSYICKPVDFKQFVTCIQQLGIYWLGLNEPAPQAR